MYEMFGPRTIFFSFEHFSKAESQICITESGSEISVSAVPEKALSHISVTEHPRVTDEREPPPAKALYQISVIPFPIQTFCKRPQS
jgi:hypothetical protein